MALEKFQVKSPDTESVYSPSNKPTPADIGAAPTSHDHNGTNPIFNTVMVGNSVYESLVIDRTVVETYGKKSTIISGITQPNIGNESKNMFEIVHLQDGSGYLNALVPLKENNITIVKAADLTAQINRLRAIEMAKSTFRNTGIVTTTNSGTSGTINFHLSSGIGNTSKFICEVPTGIGTSGYFEFNDPRYTNIYNGAGSYSFNSSNALTMNDNETLWVLLPFGSAYNGTHYYYKIPRASSWNPPDNAIMICHRHSSGWTLWNGKTLPLAASNQGWTITS